MYLVGADEYLKVLLNADLTIGPAFAFHALAEAARPDADRPGRADA